MTPLDHTQKALDEIRLIDRYVELRAKLAAGKITQAAFDKTHVAKAEKEALAAIADLTPVPVPAPIPSGSIYPSAIFDTPHDGSVDPESESRVSPLRAWIKGHGHFAVLTDNFTVPVYYAIPTTPRRDMVMIAGFNGGRKIKSVPWDPAWKPDPSTDAHWVVDDTDGCHYEGWGWGGTMPSGAGTIVALKDGVAASQGGHSACAAGFSLLGGLIFPAELEDAAKAGTGLPHALAMAVPTPECRSNSFCSPATEGGPDRTHAAGKLPMGARLFLDKAFDVESLSVDPYWKVVLRTLKAHGAFVRDGGGPNFFASSAIAYPFNPYSPVWTTLGNKYLPKAVRDQVIDQLHLAPLGPALPTNRQWNAPDTCPESPTF